MNQIQSRFFLKSFFLILSWLLFFLFIVLVLPAVSEQARNQGLSASIDTNFSFNPSEIARIISDYGIDGRRYYLWQRWTFDLIWPLVYGFPLYLTLKTLSATLHQSKFTWLAVVPMVATGLDYLENIIFTLVILNYPAPMFLWITIGVFVSGLKWLALISAYMLLIIFMILILLRFIRRKFC
jgi:hypothetical protein